MFTKTNIKNYSEDIQNIEKLKSIPGGLQGNIMEVRNNVGKDIHKILELEKIDNLNTDKIYNSIATILGDQFGFRATANKYHGKGKILPSGHSGSDGASYNKNENDDNKSIHFYVGSKTSKNRAIQLGYGVDEMLKNTIRSCVEYYAKNHFGNSSYSLIKNGLYQKKDLPVMYIFGINSDLFNFKEDRYNGDFAFHDGKHTFYEGSMTQRTIKMRPNAIKINPNFIFTISYEEYLEIDKKVRELIKNNYSLIIKKIPEIKFDLEEMSDSYFIGFINSILKIQNAFLSEIPEDKKLSVIDKKNYALIKNNIDEKIRLYTNAFYIKSIWSYYDKAVYKEFSELIWKKLLKSINL